ncbi:hypothetical protein DFH28DRAFT_277432 [Melampsora americana]|nr:hypothetical protein DFH28DRAFT_277432 [Melampsora americana]
MVIKLLKSCWMKEPIDDWLAGWLVVILFSSSSNSSSISIKPTLCNQLLLSTIPLFIDSFKPIHHHHHQFSLILFKQKPIPSYLPYTNLQPLQLGRTVEKQTSSQLTISRSTRLISILYFNPSLYIYIYKIPFVDHCDEADLN